MSFLSARTKAGLSRAVVAEKMGVTTVSVCQWETGKNLPRASLLRDIAALYNCTVDELLAPADPDPPKE